MLVEAIMRARQGDRELWRIRNHQDSGSGLKNQSCDFPVDVVDGFGRQWTASEIASSPHIIDTLDGLDDLDGASSF
jgi:hypothetical protein